MTLPLLATELRQQRTTSGLTLDQLAEQARVSRSTVAKIEAGNTPDPGYSVVARLLDSTGATDAQVLDLHHKTVGARRSRIFGIGYEGLDLADLIQELRHRRATVVADVRLTPISRKKGLSKTALREGLGKAGIDYVHLPALGNPKDNRAGYGDLADTTVRELFRDRLRTPASAAQLAQLSELAACGVVAVLCFEQDERQCHREQVLAAVTDALKPGVAATPQVANPPA